MLLTLENPTAMTNTEAKATLSRNPPPSNSDQFVRLHVTPLDAELLKVVLSSALLPKARNVSYHSLETFPEKRYGFLELPNEDAEKLRKKLNGSVLKGVKISIERARPSQSPVPLAEAAMAKDKTSKKGGDDVRPQKDKSKKRKRDAEELSGVILKGDRKIKRGWTTPDEPSEKRSKKDKEKKGKETKKQAKSKYTDHPECLVKTVLPANAAPSHDADNSTPTKKKKGRSREVVVHEFERTTKFPTFLKAAPPTAGPGASLEYVDGKGWVDEDGNVVEAVKARPPPSAKVLLPSKSEDTTGSTMMREESTGGSSDAGPAREGEPERSALGSESDSDPEAGGSDTSPLSSPVQADLPRPRSSGSVRSLSITIPPATPNEAKVHPLEALYKRTKQADGETPKAAVAGQSFSFFADGNDDSAGEDGHAAADESSGAMLPMTPFTRHDLELRGIRSAAPTPDTAHPSRRFTPWEPEHDREQQDAEDDESEESEDDEPMPSNMATTMNGEGSANSVSDFQKWFWENRGDLNRSWKRRRKMAGKEKRYRENKARMARAI